MTSAFGTETACTAVSASLRNQASLQLDYAFFMASNNAGLSKTLINAAKVATSS